jgi:hypothetical protein
MIHQFGQAFLNQASKFHPTAHGEATKAHFVRQGWQLLNPCHPSQSDWTPRSPLPTKQMGRDVIISKQGPHQALWTTVARSGKKNLKDSRFGWTLK